MAIIDVSLLIELHYQEFSGESWTAVLCFKGLIIFKQLHTQLASFLYSTFMKTSYRNGEKRKNLDAKLYCSKSTFTTKNLQMFHKKYDKIFTWILNLW